MKVFISSTFIDLVDHRKIVATAIERMNLGVGRMEVLGAKPIEPQTACLSLVDDCDLFVGIYAHRYGFVPEGSSISITESEYEYAKKKNKKIFCFILDDDHPWRPKFIEEGIGKEGLREFKNKIKKELTVDFFTTPEDLAYKVSTSLSNHLSHSPNIQQTVSFPKIHVERPTYFHGAHAKTNNGEMIYLGWVKPQECDAVKLYQGFNPGIDPADRSTFDKVECYNSVALNCGILNKGRKYYYRLSAVYENIESDPSDEICVDTSRIPIENYKSLSSKLTPTNLAASINDGKVYAEWVNPTEVNTIYALYLYFENGKSERKLVIAPYFEASLDAFESPIVGLSVAPMLYGNEGYATNRVNIK